ncbi:MAG TPA: DUF4432 family protein [Bryocella sp.]|nr:DUF4432 family protein [Bryocella sp.]
MRLVNDMVYLTVLCEGCMLAEFGQMLADGGHSQNLLWESPWTQENSSVRSDDKVRALYGDVGTGRFLERFTGHALCLNEFGAASEEDVAAGSGLHGEASLRDWSFREVQPTSVSATTELPLARLRVERRLSLLPGESIVRVDETVINLSAEAQPVHWVQHATVGPPLFGEGARAATSATRGITGPRMYGDADRLCADAEFNWPHAPGTDGGPVDLRKLFGKTGTGLVAALRQPERGIGFVAAVNPAVRVALIYIFAASDFPWLTLWEENRCRQEYPWNGHVQARGLEFGTTPLPLGRRAIDAAGDVMGHATSRRIAPNERIRAPWAMAAVRLPDPAGEIEDIMVEGDLLRIMNGGRAVEVRARGLARFLLG